MHPVFRMAQIIAARLWRPVALALVALLLSACSALQLGYNQAPSLLYWWVDAYADLDDAQSVRLRQDIDRYVAWHRQQELSGYAARLRQWQALTTGPVTADQVCAQFDALRNAAERLLRQGAEPMARLALTLSPAQQQHLQSHLAKTNRDFEKEFLRGDTSERLERRLTRTVDRYEDFYGALNDAQVARLRQGLQNSPFDPVQAMADRRKRQAELLGLIRQIQAQQTTPLTPESPVPRAATEAVRDWLLRGLAAPSAAGGDALRWERHGCQSFAELHNSSTAAQRAHVVQVLQRYESDLRALARQY